MTIKDVHEKVTVAAIRPQDAEGAMVLCCVPYGTHLYPGDMVLLESGEIATVVICQDYVDGEQLAQIIGAAKVTEIPTCTARFSKREVDWDE